MHAAVMLLYNKWKF